MSTDSTTVDSVEEDGKDLADASNKEQEQKTGQSLEEQLAYLKGINAEAIKTRDAAKRKLREFEKEAEDNKTLAASLKEKLVSKVVNDSLKQELAKAGALSIDTALKLIDKSKIALTDDYDVDPKSIEALVANLRTTDAVLFKAVEDATKEKEQEEQKHISLARATEIGNIKSAYQTAMKGAKTQRQVDEITKKFGVLK